MMAKLQEIKASIETRMEKLTAMYGEGLVEGFTPELLV